MQNILKTNICSWVNIWIHSVTSRKMDAVIYTTPVAFHISAPVLHLFYWIYDTREYFSSKIPRWFDSRIYNTNRISIRAHKTQTLNICSVRRGLRVCTSRETKFRKHPTEDAHINLRSLDPRAGDNPLWNLSQSLTSIYKAS